MHGESGVSVCPFRLAFLSLIAACLFATAALPHDWYTGTTNAAGQSCCGGQDCGTVPASSVSCDADGCDVTVTPGEHVGLKAKWGSEPMVFRFTGQPMFSPDGQNHACIVLGEIPQRIARCLWVGGAS